MMMQPSNLRHYCHVRQNQRWEILSCSTKPLLPCTTSWLYIISTCMRILCIDCELLEGNIDISPAVSYNEAVFECRRWCHQRCDTFAMTNWRYLLCCVYLSAWLNGWLTDGPELLADMVVWIVWYLLLRLISNPKNGSQLWVLWHSIIDSLWIIEYYAVVRICIGSIFKELRPAKVGILNSRFARFSTYCVDIKFCSRNRQNTAQVRLVPQQAAP